MYEFYGYDRWKLSGEGTATATCDCCGEEFDPDDLEDRAGVYVCKNCLEAVYEE